MSKLGSKVSGMTSLEIAIIVAIVLVIAIAIGWYLYVTFASASQQPGITVTEAVIYIDPSGATTLYLRVLPQGVAQVQISRIEIAGQSFDCSTYCAANSIISKPTVITLDISGRLTVSVGQILSGRIVLTSGFAVPFTASVVSGGVPGSGDTSDQGYWGTSDIKIM